MSSEPHISVNLQHRIGNLALDVVFRSAAPWTVIFGASGSGKSTILRAIAGLLRPDSGMIALAGNTVFDRELHQWLPPRQRSVRWSAQHPALFPHMTVEQNIAFGLTQDADTLSRKESRSVIARALSHFGLERFQSRHPAQLSGGEQQRVALARTAIGARGKLLLLDEPFTGLDADVRDRLIDDLRTWLGNTPILSVTHNVAEAFLLQAEVVRLADGRVAAQGPAPIVLHNERERLRTVLG